MGRHCGAVTQAAIADENRVWRDIAVRWMEQHCIAAGNQYWCTRSENFLLARLLSHLPLPLWLNEGIAVNLESSLCPRHARRLDLSWIERHRSWWDDESVQEYWTGQAFHRPDKMSELSYELAWVTVRSMAEDYELFRQFASEASFEDAGESASRKHFGAGLGRHFEAILGEGRWDPDPTGWRDE